jgi:hypothetical protein
LEPAELFYNMAMPMKREVERKFERGEMILKYPTKPT